MRDVVSVLCFVLAAALGAVALTAALLAQQVADPERPGRVLAAVLDDPAARAVVAEEVSDRLLAEQPDLPSGQVRSVTRQVLAQPTVRDVLGSVEADASGNLDSTALADDIASRLRERGQGRLADEVRERAGLLPPTSISDLVEVVERARIAAWTVAAVAGIGAVLLAFFGFASGSTGPRRWAGLGLAVVATGVLTRLVVSRAPTLVGEDSDRVVVVAASLGRAATADAFLPVVACLVVGAALLLAAVASARRR